MEAKKSRSRKTLTGNMEQIMKRQIEDLRKKLLSFKLVPRRNAQVYSYDNLPESCDILIFGPAGSGKSSLLKTFYRALHNTSRLPRELSDRIVVKGTDENEGTTKFTGLQLKPPAEYVKKSISHRDASQKSEVDYTSGIMVHDTRGQIWMDEKEHEQLRLLMKGNVKDMSMVEQRNFRYAHLLWEFWKKDSELFPTDIVRRKSTLKTRPHSLVFVFDGSMDEIPNGEEETKFYKEIIEMAREKHYFYPQIVLTRIDKVEAQVAQEYDEETKFYKEIIEMAREKHYFYPQIVLTRIDKVEAHEIPNGEEETKFYKEIIEMAREKHYFYPQIVLTRIDKVEAHEIPNGEEETKFYKEIIEMAREKHYFYPQIVLTRIDKVEAQVAQEYDLDEFEAEAKLREILDLKIESAVLKLGVSRSSVHFIENYHPNHEDDDLSIDYHALRLLHESVQQADTYLQSNLKEKTKCVIQ
eukprot:CAMPEP_0115038600 /NCGR_PEP_ID=MMETSP0216-20121206/43505_1 /TAXON_ID=223996 /ORGANISM="Protocruzia adherens, Strain Boccale" /LENGTH=467 /DNA_ID=CAMNT_0002419031 /DNA_START=43 /DNA_END=1446 /DNA_ORIENTATION=-